MEVHHIRPLAAQDAPEGPGGQRIVLQGVPLEDFQGPAERAGEPVFEHRDGVQPDGRIPAGRLGMVEAGGHDHGFVSMVGQQARRAVTGLFRAADVVVGVAEIVGDVQDFHALSGVGQWRSRRVSSSLVFTLM